MLALPWHSHIEEKEEEGGGGGGRITALTINHRAIKIAQQVNDARGSGLTVWDGAVVLARYLEAEHNEGGNSLAGRFVLELGAGTGLVGIAAHCLGAKRVCLTDLEYALDNLCENASINCCNDYANAVFCRELDWAKAYTDDEYFGMFQGVPDVIVMADVIWLASQVSILVSQLARVCQFISRHSATPPRMLFAHQTRSRHTDKVLFDSLHAHGFKARQLTSSALVVVQVYELS